MNKIFLILSIATIIGCKSVTAPTTSDKKIEEVTYFKGQQITGLSISDQGRMFANFPRWRKDVENSVVEIDKNGISHAFPNENWNSWEIGQAQKDSVFIGVQSVIAFEDELYVLDTRNALFKGVLDSPRVFVFDLETQTLKRTYIFEEDSFHQDSYMNDLRIDKKKEKVYITDSGHAGLVILDLVDGTTKRVLNNHYSTLAEKDHLIIEDNRWNNTVHSDGIALDTENDLLYYHALTGYGLYAVPTEVLINGTEEAIQKEVKFIKKTPAPDGMLFDTKGNLYFADLEQQKIMKLNISSGKMSTFAEGEKIRWADTFSIYKNSLYYTNSRINEITGPIINMEFSINKISLD
ncbi:L-dopachrome tautomerase-related protein [Gillisia sp. JM1]|uniref:L-dopachrome tautomerase-related protein n=1 Tax=Gillisia sp. JM1 TaxID=1283286 RepID=UPI000479E59A|nr:L-dopachrome tautomerase-related protein [Gillisia sp. JM1]